MPYTEQEVKEASIDLVASLNELLIWRWEEEKNVLLAEFASGKADKVIAILQQHCAHEWNIKSIKNAPKSIKIELADNAKLIKNQRIFTNPPKNDQKSVVAILWPWGHGSTYSLRLTLLDAPYEYIQPTSSKSFLSRFFQKAKGLFA